MNLKLNEKIRDLRKTDSRTQENLADALGVTSQAVSRWEQGLSYPDMELIPAIANYFGITIDELFGYENDRDRRIAGILERNEILSREDNGVDVHLDERLRMLRDGLSEFPSNEKLTYALADTLVNAGYIRIGQTSVVDCNYYVTEADRHQKNPYWNEAIPIFEKLIGETRDERIREKSAGWLIDLYCNMGENDKAMAIAEKMPSMNCCREFLMARSARGEEEEKLRGNLLIQLTQELAFSMVAALQTKPANFETDLPVRKLQAVIDLYHAVFEDGNFGSGHNMLCQLYLYLSEHQWRIGAHDEAFASLDKALEHARSLETISKTGEYKYTDPLLEKVVWKFPVNPTPEIAETLPEDWPFWFRPDCSDVKKEITADPRWDAWVKKCKA